MLENILTRKQPFEAAKEGLKKIIFQFGFQEAAFSEGEFVAMVRQIGQQLAIKSENIIEESTENFTRSGQLTPYYVDKKAKTFQSRNSQIFLLWLTHEPGNTGILSNFNKVVFLHYKVVNFPSGKMLSDYVYENNPDPFLAPLKPFTE